MPTTSKAIGITAQTPQNLLVDAGALWANFGLPNERLIGATSGGNSFEVKINWRQIKADGVKGNVKGYRRFVSAEVTLKSNLLEVTPENLSMVLLGQIDNVTDPDFDIITGKTVILDEDYLENVALIGTESATDKDVIIIVKNALSTEGLTIKTEDDNDATLPVTFTGHMSIANPKELPYEIRYPHAVTV